MASSGPDSERGDQAGYNEEAEDDVAAAMGFGSFGAKPHPQKKRKTNATGPTGSNSVALGMRPAHPDSKYTDTSLAAHATLTHQTLVGEGRRDTDQESAPTLFLPAPTDLTVTFREYGTAEVDAVPQTAHREPGRLQNGDWDWYALKRGVKNQQGDIAFYDASFIEDPWAHLRKKT